MLRITRKGRLIQKEILEYISKSHLPLSTRQLTLELNYSWNTIQRHCLELLSRQKIERLELPGSHLWISQGTYINTQTPNESITVRSTETTTGTSTLKSVTQQLEEQIDATVSALLETEIEKQLEAVESEIEKNVEKNVKNKKSISSKRSEEKKSISRVVRHE